MKKFLIMISIILLTSSCKEQVSSGQNQNERYSTNISNSPSPTIQTATQPSINKLSVYSQVKSLIKNYEETLIQAINNHSINLVKPFIIKDSSFYKSQVKLVDSLNSRGITEQLHSFEVLDIRSEGTNEYKIYVSEDISINYPDKPEVRKQFLWIYTAIINDSEIGLNNIEEWSKDDYMHKAGSVKADGYYSSEIVNSYTFYLKKFLNGSDYSQFNNLFDNEKIVDLNIETLKLLKNRGENLNLIKEESEFDPLTNYNKLTNLFEYKIKYTFTYTTKDGNSKTDIILIQFDIKETHEGFAGNSIIKNIKVL
jgi:hypothetical protein